MRESGCNFVVETKDAVWEDDLRGVESAKLKCGKAHFDTLTVAESPVQYIMARSLDDVLAHCEVN